MPTSVTSKKKAVATKAKTAAKVPAKSPVKSKAVSAPKAKAKIAAIPAMKTKAAEKRSSKINVDQERSNANHLLDIADYFFSITSFFMLLLIDIVFVAVLTLTPLFGYAANNSADNIFSKFAPVVTDSTASIFLFMALVITLVSIILTVIRVVIAVRTQTKLVEAVKSLIFDMVLLIFFVGTMLVTSWVFVPLAQVFFNKAG